MPCDAPSKAATSHECDGSRAQTGSFRPGTTEHRLRSVLLRIEAIGETHQPTGGARGKGFVTGLRVPYVKSGRRSRQASRSTLPACLRNHFASGPSRHAPHRREGDDVTVSLVSLANRVGPESFETLGLALAGKMSPDPAHVQGAKAVPKGAPNPPWLEIASELQHLGQRRRRLAPPSLDVEQLLHRHADARHFALEHRSCSARLVAVLCELRRLQRQRVVPTSADSSRTADKQKVTKRSTSGRLIAIELT